MYHVKMETVSNILETILINFNRVLMHSRQADAPFVILKACR
jgi:hypothetical protein